MKLLKIFLTLSLCFLFCNPNEKKFNLNEKLKDFKISGYVGQISPITSSDRSAFNPGLSIGIGLISPIEINILKQNLKWGLGFGYSNLKGNTSSNKKVSTASINLINNFNKIPLIFQLGIGISDDSEFGITGSGIIDIMHKIPNEKIDVHIGIRMHNIFNVTDSWSVEHANTLYGLNLILSHSI